MNISFGEMLIIGIVALLFYKPEELRGFVASIFKMKKDIENEVTAITNGPKEKIEFFENKEECQKQ